MYCVQSITFWHCIYGSKAISTFGAPRSATVMEPKRKKTSAEKRRDRGPNSPWSQFGSKKAARTDRWYNANYSPLPAAINQFIEAHNIPHDDLLALITEHYGNDGPSSSHEPSLDTTKQGQTPAKCVVADGPGRSSSSSDQPMEPAREVLVGAALSALPTAVESPLPTDLPTEAVYLPDPVSPPSFDFGGILRIPKPRREASTSPHQVINHHEASDTHPKASPPPQPPLPPDGFDPPNVSQLQPGVDEIFTSPPERARFRAPQIPPQPGKLPPKRSTPHRYSDNPTRRDAASCREDREETILSGFPAPPQFTIFGPSLGGTARTPRQPAPVPSHSSPLPCGEDTDSFPAHRSVWEDHAHPKIIDDRSPGGAYTIHPSELFTVGPGPATDAAARIAAMRMPSYFKPSDGTLGGYGWATSVRQGSAGRRVKYRFEDDGNCRTPSMTALDEITAFTNKRSLPTPEAINESDLSNFTIRKVYPLGTLLKIDIGKPPQLSTRS